MIKRLAGTQDILFGDKKEFVYFAPGRIPDCRKGLRPGQEPVSHEIVTTV